MQLLWFGVLQNLTIESMLTAEHPVHISHRLRNPQSYHFGAAILPSLAAILLVASYRNIHQGEPYLSIEKYFARRIFTELPCYPAVTRPQNGHKALRNSHVTEIRMFFWMTCTRIIFLDAQ